MTRFGYVMTTYFAMLGIGALAFFHPAPRLIWNATASTPTGTSNSALATRTRRRLSRGRSHRPEYPQGFRRRRPHSSPEGPYMPGTGTSFRRR